MKVSGFTLIRNGEKFDYPYLESYRSLLPMVDEFIINVGESEDSTLEKIENFSRNEGQGKIKIIKSIWPIHEKDRTQKGLILSEQTNIALDQCQGDWCLYLQSDEVLHENEHKRLRAWLEEGHRRSDVEGLLFQYHHFYGSYDIVQKTRSAYRREVRAVKKSACPKSVGDAQSFRNTQGEKLKVLLTDCHIFHYGWVRTPDAMKIKTVSMDELYHGKSIPNALPATKENYKYKRFWGLKPFTGTHPVFMKDRIQNKNWNWDFKNSPFTFHWKDTKRITFDLIEKISGVRLFEYRSYKLIK